MTLSHDELHRIVAHRLASDFLSPQTAEAVADDVLRPYFGFGPLDDQHLPPIPDDFAAALPVAQFGTGRAYQRVDDATAAAMLAAARTPDVETDTLDIMTLRQQARWRSYYRHSLLPAIGTVRAERLLADLAADPERHIDGYLADSIYAWRGEDGAHDYSDCSGSEYFPFLHARPDLWDMLLSRAPAGDQGGEPGARWAKTYPHERERIARYRALGWHCTMGLSGDVWRERDPLTGDTPDTRAAAEARRDAHLHPPAPADADWRITYRWAMPGPDTFARGGDKPARTDRGDKICYEWQATGPSVVALPLSAAAHKTARRDRTAADAALAPIIAAILALPEDCITSEHSANRAGYLVDLIAPDLQRIVRDGMLYELIERDPRAEAKRRALQQSCADRRALAMERALAREAEFARLAEA